jgi:N6-adenosine-specific RNA methylase IME4
MKYRLILADPPWAYRNEKTGGTNMISGASSHYPVMSMEELRQLPIKELAHDDSLLILWVTNPLIPQGVELVKAWGFEYVTGFPWIKVKNVSHSLWDGIDIKLNRMALGFWVRGVSEYVMIARRGNVHPPSDRFIGLLANNIRHSRKPDDIYQLCESFEGPYLELFARRSRPGWDVFGNEVQNSIVLAK